MEIWGCHEATHTYEDEVGSEIIICNHLLIVHQILLMIWLEERSRKTLQEQKISNIIFDGFNRMLNLRREELK